MTTPLEELQEILKELQKPCSRPTYPGQKLKKREEAQQSLQDWFLKTVDECLPKEKPYEDGDHEDVNWEQRFIKAAHNNAIKQAKANAAKLIGGK